MKKTIIVLLLILGLSMLLTALAVIFSPDLLKNPGGIAAVFGAVSLAIFGLGNGAIKGWVDLLFEKKTEKNAANNGVFVAHADKVEYIVAASVDKTDSENKPAEVKNEKKLPEQEALRAYLAALIEDFRPLSLAGMDTHSGDTKARLPLEDIYISLNTTEQMEKEKGRKNEKDNEAELMAQMGREESKPLTALDALLKKRRMVLLGAPGTGKSTFVRYLSLRLAKQLNDPAAKPLENWQGKPILPIAISLGRLAEFLPVNSKTGAAELVEDFIRSMLEADSRMKYFAPYVLQVLQDQGGLVLFDGLDEVANLELRPVVVKSIEAFAEKYGRNPHSRFLATCRILSYQDKRWHLTDWTSYELALLSPAQIKRFIEIWHDLHAALEPARAAIFNSKKPRLLSAVQASDPRRLYEVARYPIILTMMAIVHASHELPDSRARVYEECVKLLLDKWQSSRSISQGKYEVRSLAEELGISASSIYEPLYEIAFKAHSGQKAGKAESAGSLITEGLISGVLHDYLQDHEQEKIFLKYCREANGLLMWSGTITEAGSNVRRSEYKFPHLTFEEFLAGRHLKKLDTDEIRALFDDTPDRWREPIKFMGELYCFSEDPNRDALNGLLEAFSSSFPDHPSQKDWQALWLAGELLTYYKRVWVKKKSVFEDTIVANLRRLVFESPLTPRERADVADILDQLAQPDDLYAFIATPDAPTPNLFVSKYLVTNEQYQRFLTAPDFAEQKYWVDFPKFDENSKEMQENWGEEGWKFLQENIDKEGKLEPRYWRDPRFGINRRYAPVVGVSWYEVSAYCKWLSQNWQTQLEAFIPHPSSLSFRLPLESEWAFAAGGEANDRFAFGELKDSKKEIMAYANTSESEIGRTTPVWMYPQGKSPYDIMDMSGNVWEWQANYKNMKQGYLGLRGGSWLLNGGSARAAFRYYFYVLPNHWDLVIGFRVVALAPPSELL